MTVSCLRCGEEWPRDPAREVKCPYCLAPVGSPCKRPSGHGCDIHAERDRLAMEMGFLQKCPAAMMPATDNPQLSLL